MKTFSRFLLALLPACFYACMPVQSLVADPSEQYIKTQVEEHDPGQTSSIRIYPLYTVAASNVQAELRFTGYKYKNEKKLVLCVRPYVLTTSAGKTTRAYSNSVFLTLTQAECQAIVDNHAALRQKLETETGAPGEYVYSDYTVNEELFISYRGEANLFTKSIAAPMYLDFWVRGEKYTLTTTEVIDKIRKFLAY